MTEPTRTSPVQKLDYLKTTVVQQSIPFIFQIIISFPQIYGVYPSNHSYTHKHTYSFYFIFPTTVHFFSYSFHTKPSKATTHTTHTLTLSFLSQNISVVSWVSVRSKPHTNLETRNTRSKMGGSGSGAGSFLMVLLRNFDVLAGYVFFSYNPNVPYLLSSFFLQLRPMCFFLTCVSISGLWLVLFILCKYNLNSPFINNICKLVIFTSLLRYCLRMDWFVYCRYASVRAIESKSPVDDQQWLTYWVLYSLITLFELTFAKILEWYT